MLKPLVKWAGGKRQIMKILLQHFPSEFNNYHEPFVGAASVFLEMFNRGLLADKKVYLSDVLAPLMNLYDVVKYNHENLIKEFSRDNYQNNKDVYDVLREHFNALKNNITYDNQVKVAALFIYLNKTGFNGMYRENKNGQFNIPFGKQKQTCYYSYDNLMSLHSCLSNDNIHLSCCSYEQGFDFIETGDFIYMDPPYFNTFNNYNKDKFDEKEQQLLKDYFVKLSNKGCKVALSNSKEQFIIDLYKDVPNVRFIEFQVKRYVNSKGCDRKIPKSELLIVNY